MLAAPTFILFLAAGDPAQLRASPPPAEAPRAQWAQVERSPAEAELEWCAERIEALKSRQQVGRELDRLLRRAEELAAKLDRARGRREPPAAPAAPSPEELRERADAARDEADRLAADIATIDVRIHDARRVRGEPGGPVERAVLGAAPADGDRRLHALVEQRAALSEARARAETEAVRLEREALAAEEAELERFRR